MSDVLSDAQMYLSEPDETVLTAALRNKDDIPILMDVVGADEVTTPVSQEMHLKKLLSSDKEPEKAATHFQYEPPETRKSEFQYEPPEDTVAEVAQTVTSSVKQSAEALATAPQKSSKSDQSQIIAAAIRSVLERRLPQLVAEVMTEISKREEQ
ncbi:hypothetical protein MAQ5080_01580 [Marinomonas aquimarina]|uniref:Uncharacterized protein n=1 Tax=Marinomonas aquimarina TaxID=295068 RepID=A0A1A8TE47_9GAMM|nr:hypothetical protein [Marinomonas aquimarina]SBS30079.1 hypothetical protein MAQ5080_01580 [Marinomonas aquimarina]